MTRQITQSLAFFLTFSLFLYPLSIKAQDTIVYTADQKLMDIGQRVYVYRDQTNALTFEQIRNLPDAAFQKSTTSPMRLGNTTASTWLKFVVKNETEFPLFLAFQTNAINILDAFIYDETGKLTTKEAGFHRPTSNRELMRSNVVMNIGQSPKVLYVKVESRFVLLLPLVLARLEHLEAHYHPRDVINGLGMGILIAMALYNLFIFFSVKDRLYLYYCIYVLASLWVIGHLNGLGWLIWMDYPVITRLVGIPFALLATWLFTVRFLNVAENMPRIYMAIKAFCLVIACIIPLDFLDLQVPRAAMQQICTPLSAFSMLTIGIISHFQGNRNAKYYVLAWAFLLGGAIISSFSYAGLIPYNDYTSNSFLLGAAIESILLAFALANRINMYREESIQSKNLALERLQENEALIRERNRDLEEKVHARTTELEQSLAVLKATQNQLIQSEKLASLGELTAGIAHEIQNPLNFVNNFSELSVDLAKELNEELDKQEIDKPYVKEILGDLTSNQERINHHGKRASSIVKGMLEHSRTSTGEKESVDINHLVDESFRLSYHGLRAKDKGFNATMEKEYQENLPKMSAIPQDMGRVILNLINNAFYAVNQRQQARPQPPEGEYDNAEGAYDNAEGEHYAAERAYDNVGIYKPTVLVSTHYVAPLSGLGGQIIIKIKDNGTGMPESLKAKIFQPFFTTKPTGEGTGLGLSLSYDIITKGHGGTLDVESREGEGTVFIITLPC